MIGRGGAFESVFIRIDTLPRHLWPKLVLHLGTCDASKTDQSIFLISRHILEEDGKEFIFVDPETGRKVQVGTLEQMALKFIFFPVCSPLLESFG